MKVAANRGDLEIVKWLFTHFSDGQVPVEVTEACVRGGNLSMLQFLHVNDSGRRDREEDEGHMTKKIEAVGGEIQVRAGMPQGCGAHVVAWGPRVMESAKRGKQYDIVRWLVDNVSEYKKEKDAHKERKIVAALEDGDDALAKALMPPGRCILDYAAQCLRLDLIEMMLDCGYIRRDRDCANSAIRQLACEGRLDLMQQVVLLHSPPPKDESLCLDDWSVAIRKACGNGYLTMLKWLIEHPLGQILCEHMRLRQDFSNLVYLAGCGGHVDVMQVIRGGRYNTTKWLVEHVRFSESGFPADYIIGIAVRGGRLDILKLFHEMDSVGMINQTQSEQNQSDQVSAWWTRTQDKAINMAATCGHLEILQWLLSNRPGKCTVSAMERAAEYGKLEMVQWLHANRSEGCTATAMDAAATQGHLEVVKWLHVNRSEGCTIMAMDGALPLGCCEMASREPVGGMHGTGDG